MTKIYVIKKVHSMYLSRFLLHNCVVIRQNNAKAKNLGPNHLSIQELAGVGNPWCRNVARNLGMFSTVCMRKRA